MTQGFMFDESGHPTPEAQASAVGTACSAEAREKVDDAYLRCLTAQEFKLFSNGATADEIAHRLQLMKPDVDEFSIRPRVTELKTAGILVPTGQRRANRKGNNCAVLMHCQFAQEAA